MRRAYGRIGAYLAALAAVKQLVAVRAFMRHASAAKFFKISKADGLEARKILTRRREKGGMLNFTAAIYAEARWGLATIKIYAKPAVKFRG